MKKKGLGLKMLVLICLTLFLNNIVVVQAEFSVSTTLPVPTPREGDATYIIQCNIQVTNLTENATYTYIWTKDNMLVTVSEQVQDDFVDRFSIVLSSNDPEPDVYQLSISTLAIADSGLYTCLVAGGSVDNTTTFETLRNSTLASSNETLSVEYFPAQDPICSNDITGPVENGMGITLSCMSTPSGNPVVDLRWNGLEQQEVTRTENKVTLDQRVFITSQENGTSFTCAMTSSDSYPGEERSCTIGPIVVIPGEGFVTVDLRISPSSFKGEIAELSCKLNAPGTMIMWYTDPPTDSNRIIIIGNDLFRILNLTMDDIGKRVFCEGTRGSDGKIFREYIELLPATTTEPLPTTTISTTTVTSATTAGSVVLTTTSPPGTSTPSRNITISTSQPEGIDIILIAVVAAAGGFVLLVVAILGIACCCCCKRQAVSKDTKPPVEYADWEGPPPSHARTAPVQPPSTTLDRGPTDPIVVRNPTHGVPQTEILIDPPDQPGQTEMSPSLAFAMKNLVDEDEISDDESQADERLRIPRAVAREPPQARKKNKNNVIPSGSFVSRGHPLKRTPLNSLERDSAGEPLYSSAEQADPRIRRDPTYASMSNPSGLDLTYGSAERASSGLPPDVTVTRDPSVAYAKVDRKYGGIQMPDVTVGLTDDSPIINVDGSAVSPTPSPDNTVVPKKKKLPAGARAAIGPGGASKGLARQQTSRLSAEISNQDIVPTLTSEASPETDLSPINEAPNVAPPTYEDVSRLKASGMINSGFQLGPTDTMVIHNVADGNSHGTTNKVDDSKEIKYF